MEETYSLEEVKNALAKIKEYFIAPVVIEDILKRMQRRKMQTIPKSELSETEFELLDWALFTRKAH